jgi:hypothetical protein
MIDHATSLLRVITLDLQNIQLSKVNKAMHLNMAFHYINDGFNNLVH